MMICLHDDQTVPMFVEDTWKTSGYQFNYYFLKLSDFFLDEPEGLPIISDPDEFFDESRALNILPTSFTLRRSDIAPFMNLTIETTYLSIFGVKPTKLWSQRIIRAMSQEQMLKILGWKNTSSQYSDGIFASHIMKIDSDYHF